MSKEEKKLITKKKEKFEFGEEDKYYKEKRKKYIFKGISSLISCIIHTFGYFSVWTLGNYVVYLISFRRHYNPNLTFSHGYFLFPIMNLALSLTAPIGGIIEDKIGGKKTIILSTLILCTGFFFTLIIK